MQKRVIILLLALIFLEISFFKTVLFFREKEVQKKTQEAEKVSLIGLTNPTHTPTPTPTNTPTPTLSPTLTPIPTLIPIIILPQDLDSLFTKYASQYSVDKELLKKIAKCESNFNSNASTSLYVGLFQFAQPIWVQTRTLMGLDSDVNLRFNAEESIRTAAFMVSQGHLGIWPNCSK